MKGFSAPAFSLAYCIAYALLFAFDAPLFIYYPLEGVFAWKWAPFASLGPAMAWYGLVTGATLIALSIALLAPQRELRGRSIDLLWITPLVVIVFCAWRLRFFFA